jgi:hypothetical protein
MMLRECNTNRSTRLGCACHHLNYSDKSFQRVQNVCFLSRTDPGTGPGTVLGTVFCLLHFRSWQPVFVLAVTVPMNAVALIVISVEVAAAVMA